MSATPQSAPRPPPGIPVTVLSLLLVVLGLVIAPRGLLPVSGLGLLRHRRGRPAGQRHPVVWQPPQRGRCTYIGVHWYAAVDLVGVRQRLLALVPRLGLVTALGIVLALLAPTLREPVSKRLSRSVAGVLMLVFVAAFGLAFAPHGEVDGHLPFPEGAASAGLEPTRDTTGLQPAGPARRRRLAGLGRSNAGTRYRRCSRSPGSQRGHVAAGLAVPYWRHAEALGCGNHAAEASQNFVQRATA